MKYFEVVDIFTPKHNRFYLNGKLLDYRSIKFVWRLSSLWVRWILLLPLKLSFETVFKVLKFFTFSSHIKSIIDIEARLLSNVYQKDLNSALATDEIYVNGSQNDYVVSDGLINLFRLKSDKVKICLNTAVDKIDYLGTTVKVSTNQGGYEFDKVLITVSLGVLQSAVIEFAPALPDYKRKAISSVDFAKGEKIFYYYDEAFFDKKADLIGIFNSNSKNKVDLSNPTFFVNFSNIHSNPVLVEFVYDSTYESIKNFTDEELKSRNLNLLQSVYGKRAKSPVRIVKSNWTTNCHFQGTYSADNVNSMDRELIRKNVDEKLYFAGEAAWRMYGYMDAAHDSAIQSCKEMMRV